MQPKKPIGLSKPKKLSVERVREISDSLRKQSVEDKYFARVQENIAKRQIKSDGGNVPMPNIKPLWKGYEEGPTGFQRMKIAQKYKSKAKVDSANAVRYSKLADKASKKK